MKKNQNPKVLVLVLQGLVISAGLFPQTVQDRLLSPEIVENFFSHWERIERVFEDLDNHEDPEIRARFDAYNDKMNVFGRQLDDFWEFSPMDGGEAPDIVKAYQKILRILVPPEVHEVYRESGLGNRGHQVITCLFVGFEIVIYNKQNETCGDQSTAKAQKKLTRLESLIHPEDLALIEGSAPYGGK
jgi:hypothetical protein